MYDLIIIGGGPAGLVAAVYAARAGLKFIVLEQDGWGGGQIAQAVRVDNFPGMYGITGADLGDKIKEHAEKLGAEIVTGTAEEVLADEGHLQIRTDSGETLKAKTVIAATGAMPRKLGVPGEDELLGNGVSYCATCDGDFYRNKDVAVVGGGDTAVEDAILLSNICSSVTLIHRREVFRAAKTRLNALKSLSNVSMKLNETVRQINGSRNKLSIELNRTDGGSDHLNADGLFIAAGIIPITGYLQNLPLTFKNGYVAADESGKTQVPGLFVAGDIRAKRLRQVVTSAADGANAATSVIDYLL